MYSTKLNDERFVIYSIAVRDKARIIQFLVDTGAAYTCCNYKNFDKNMREKDFTGCDVKMLGGFIEGVGVKFYRLGLKQFTIGNVDMDAQDIWITFDKRVKETVLGMDILKQITFIANAYNQNIYFCKDANDYYENFELLIKNN